MSSSRPSPLQLTLFPEHVRLTHHIPDANRHRFYLLRTLPTLFGDWIVLREWGQIGLPGRVRRDRHETENDALSTLIKLACRKRRRGYGFEQMH